MPPRDPGVEHEQDPLQQRLPVRQPLPTRIAIAPLHLRQQRLDPLPQLVRHDPRRSSHRHPSQLDDRYRRRSSSAKGSLHFGATSKPERSMFASLARDRSRSKESAASPELSAFLYTRPSSLRMGSS